MMTVNMYETKIQTLDENFKNMMTYGLNGCTAGFVVYKEEKILRYGCVIILIRCDLK